MFFASAHPAPRRCLCAVLLSAACAAACDGAANTARAGEAEGGPVAIVHNGEAGLWKSGQEWRLTEVVRIGSDSDGPDMFGQIVDLAIDPLGRVWVADAHAHQLRVFEPDGRHVRSLGRKGGGPGEFAQLAGMDFAPNGALWVQDPENSRWTVYDTAGTMVTTHIRPAGVGMVPWPGGFDRQGRLYDIGPVPSADGQVGHAILRLQPDLQPADTFPLPPFEGDFFEVITGDKTHRNIQRVNVPFTGNQVWRVDPEGSVWTAVTDRYRLVRHGYRGDTTRIVEREQRPVRISRTEMSEVVKSYQWFVDIGGTLDRSRIPSNKPPFDSFFFSPDGHMWVITGQGENEPVRFDIFDSRGLYLGRVTGGEHILPVPAPVIRGDLFAAVAQSETGVPSVVVMRIERPLD